MFLLWRVLLRTWESLIIYKEIFLFPRFLVMIGIHLLYSLQSIKWDVQSPNSIKKHSSQLTGLEITALRHKGESWGHMAPPQVSGAICLKVLESSYQVIQHQLPASCLILVKHFSSSPFLIMAPHFNIQKLHLF